MTKYKMLVLTDHSTHSVQNSIYSLLRHLRQHPYCEFIDVASRGNPSNAGFFFSFSNSSLWANRVGKDFDYRPDGEHFTRSLRQVELQNYDIILLRLPHPIPDGFWPFLKNLYPERQIINRPSGVERSSSKTFLLEVAGLCPPMRICHTIEDIKTFKERFPIVLKPFHGYGGKGIIRIDGERVWIGLNESSFADFEKQFYAYPMTYLGMKYMKNVGQGDKRVVVINGTIIGASLRTPAPDSWLCNGAQGGTSSIVDVTEEERRMVQRLASVLAKMGVIFFGFDTLVNDNGKRVLSEVNTLSIGGLLQMSEYSNEPVLEKAADLLWGYVKNTIYDKSNITR